MMVIPLKGEGVDAMDKAMQSAQKLMAGTEQMLQSINNIIGDPKTQDALKHSLQSTAVMADNAVAVTQNMADVTAQLNQAAQQFNADGNAGNDMRAILTNIKQTTDRVDHMARSIGRNRNGSKKHKKILKQHCIIRSKFLLVSINC